MEESVDEKDGWIGVKMVRIKDRKGIEDHTGDGVDKSR